MLNALFYLRPYFFIHTRAEEFFGQSNHTRLCRFFQFRRIGWYLLRETCGVERIMSGYSFEQERRIFNRG